MKNQNVIKTSCFITFWQFVFLQMYLFNLRKFNQGTIANVQGVPWRGSSVCSKRLSPDAFALADRDLPSSFIPHHHSVFISSRLRVSAATNNTPSPSCSESFFPHSLLKSENVTFHPRFENRRTAAAPIPEAPPVINFHKIYISPISSSFNKKIVSLQRLIP